jgi:prevent-host-death family protein
MSETVSAAEANRSFSKLLRAVREGRSYVVTSHGRPVARIVPVDETDDARQRARWKLMDRLRSQPVIDRPRNWTRDDLYEG